VAFPEVPTRERVQRHAPAVVSFRAVSFEIVALAWGGADKARGKPARSVPAHRVVLELARRSLTALDRRLNLYGLGLRAQAAVENLKCVTRMYEPSLAAVVAFGSC